MIFNNFLKLLFMGQDEKGFQESKQEKCSTAYLFTISFW